MSAWATLVFACVHTVYKTFGTQFQADCLIPSFYFLCLLIRVRPKFIQRCDLRLLQLATFLYKRYMIFLVKKRS